MTSTNLYDKCSSSDYNIFEYMIYDSVHSRYIDIDIFNTFIQVLLGYVTKDIDIILQHFKANNINIVHYNRSFMDYIMTYANKLTTNKSDVYNISCNIYYKSHSNWYKHFIIYQDDKATVFNIDSATIISSRFKQLLYSKYATILERITSTHGYNMCKQAYNMPNYIIAGLYVLACTINNATLNRRLYGSMHNLTYTLVMLYNGCEMLAPILMNHGDNTIHVLSMKLAKAEEKIKQLTIERDNAKVEANEANARADKAEARADKAEARADKAETLLAKYIAKYGMINDK